MTSNDLMEAYLGYYGEDENPSVTDPSVTDPRAWAEEKIKSHTPKERLEIYLEWNGILGYTSRIWEISQGEC